MIQLFEMIANLVLVKFLRPAKDLNTFFSSTTETRYSIDRGWSISSETRYNLNSSCEFATIWLDNCTFQFHDCKGNVDERVWIWTMTSRKQHLQWIANIQKQ